MAPRYRFLEHPSDAYVEASGASLAEALVGAAKALFAVMVDLRGVRVRQWVEVEVSAADREALLVEWLNELIFLGERHRWIPLEVEVARASEGEVRARARGAVLPEAPSLVKAATMHGLRLGPTAEGLEAEVILDV